MTFVKRWNRIQNREYIKPNKGRFDFMTFFISCICISIYVLGSDIKYEISFFAEGHDQNI